MGHEEELIRAFISPTKRSRYLEFISKPQTRKKFLGELAHFKALDQRYLVLIPSSERHARNIASILQRKGAPQTCYVTSENSQIDGREMLPSEALGEVVGPS